MPILKFIISLVTLTLHTTMTYTMTPKMNSVLKAATPKMDSVLKAAKAESPATREDGRG